MARIGALLLAGGFAAVSGAAFAETPFDGAVVSAVSDLSAQAHIDRPSVRDRLIDDVQSQFHDLDRASPETRRLVYWVTDAMLRRAPLSTVAAMRSCRYEFMVLPPDEKSSSYARRPEFPRSWKRRAVLRSIDNENVLGNTLWGLFQKRGIVIRDGPAEQSRYVIAHEWAHAVEGCGMNSIAVFLGKDIYDERKGSGRPFATWYAETGSMEDFADAAAVWFHLHPTILTDAEWIRKNDPRMARLLEDLFGPPIDLLPGATACAADASACRQPE